MSKAIIRIFSGFVAGALFAGLGAAAMAAPQIRWLQSPSGNTSYATVVSADGSVVGGGYQEINGAHRLSRWTEGTGMQDLGPIPPTNSPGFTDISADGQTMVVHSINYTTDTYHSYRWTAQAGLVPVGTLGAPAQSIVYSASSDGSLMLGTNTSTEWGTWRPFRWSAAGGTQYLSGPGGIAKDFSADGSRTVGLKIDPTTGVVGGVQWTVAGNNITETPLELFPEYISGDGQTIVGRSELGHAGQALRWTQQHGTVPLNSGGGTFAYIGGISGDGSIIVGSYTANGGRAMIWDEALGVRDLQTELVNRYGMNLTGVTLEYANAISDDGRTIVGRGRGPNSHTQAWIVTIPEPAALSLLMLTLPLFRRARAGAIVT